MIALQYAVFGMAGMTAVLTIASSLGKMLGRCEFETTIAVEDTSDLDRFRADARPIHLDWRSIDYGNRAPR